ncbi:MAG TPA: hypothetical protein VF169_15090 [Albitalea sp.]|uniref:hypothetical protein n=1 Tax=Piscinibacter sp. TaxID=1903157 RepID=UPI002ED54E31
MSDTTEFTLSSGQKIEVWAITGTIADDRHSSSTRIHTRGGGGFVGPSGGFVDPPEVRSTTTTHQHIWITDSDGLEHAVSLQNLEVPLRGGQKVTLYATYPDSADNGRYEALFNHSTQRFYNLARHFTPQIRLTQGYRGSVIATLLVVLALVVGGLAWHRLDAIQTEAGKQRTRDPYCAVPSNQSSVTKAQRIAEEKQVADCKVHLPEIKAEFKKAAATYAALTREANMWVVAQAGCVLALLIAGVVRGVRRSAHKQRIWQEYLNRLDAVAGTSVLGPTR